MPTSTFFNLSEEKRARIFDAAVEEFSTYTFKDASINRIIGRASIPRGSFYQYFSGKQDIYIYMLEEISKEKLSLFLYLSPEAGFFEATEQALPHLLEWGRSRPRYLRIAAIAAGDAAISMIMAPGRLNESRAAIITLLERDRQRGILRPGVDLELLCDFIFSASLSMLQRIEKTGDIHKAAADVLEFYDIIKYGACKREGEK